MRQHRAWIDRRLTNRLPLRVPLAAGLVLIGTGLLPMRAVDANSEWMTLLVGLLVGGLVASLDSVLASRPRAAQHSE